MAEHFTMMGQTVPRIAIIQGSILSAWGALAYFAQSADPPSITALIPAFMGLPMIILGVLSQINDANRHHYMHASMILALLMALGGSRLALGWSDMSGLALISHLFLLIGGISFIVIGVMSFRHARLMRESAVNE
jgi:hypothetical protein|tara:strand:- start:350 stop:754 length:405 start_codon:yes stop_codon:yes gene_type:complete